MKKYLYIFIFILSSCFFISNIKADYEATVFNPSGSSCSLYSGSTGYCVYSDSNLNNYVKGLIWLDTGDLVTVISDKPKVESNDKNVCSDYYVYISFYFDRKSTTYYGYYCNNNLSSESKLTDEMKEEFKKSGFPESYWKKLAILKSAHPNWNFEAIITGINFEDAVEGESIGSRSLIQGSDSNNYAYLALDYDAFDYYKDDYTPYDNTKASWNNRWYRANKNTIAYYMDPRNFLNDTYIFQFQGLSYDSERFNKETLKEIIEKAYKSGSLVGFAETFIEAGEKSGVDPIYLTALSIQEVGINGGTATSGNYNGMYNFYNIGATGGETPAINGLNYAAKADANYLRPWDTPQKSIIGGAIWIGKNYISMGQNTSYFKRFNILHDYLKNKIDDPYNNYTHQYQTNIKAPSSEAYTSYKSYYSSNLLDLNLNFLIPVYNNMPEYTSLPKVTGWPNNYLSSIKINDNNITDFDGGVENYNFYLPSNIEKITIDAKAVSDKATINGNGIFDITKDTEKEIVVTAENGAKKNYKIKIILTEPENIDPVDVVSTLNNTDIKNNDKYLSGFIVGSDISTISQKIKNVNKDAIITIKNNIDEEKNSGIISTGDIVTIKIGDDSKNYETVIYGDSNGDGEIDALDYVKIRKYIMNSNNLSGAYLEASDANKDGEVDSLDYVKIRKYIMNSTSIVQ